VLVSRFISEADAWGGSGGDPEASDLDEQTKTQAANIVRHIDRNSRRDAVDRSEYEKWRQRPREEWPAGRDGKGIDSSAATMAAVSIPPGRRRF
jgi:hypothetical protein